MEHLYVANNQFWPQKRHFTSISHFPRYVLLMSSRTGRLKIAGQTMEGRMIDELGKWLLASWSLPHTLLTKTPPALIQPVSFIKCLQNLFSH